MLAQISYAGGQMIIVAMACIWWAHSLIGMNEPDKAIILARECICLMAHIQSDYNLIAPYISQLLQRTADQELNPLELLTRLTLSDAPINGIGSFHYQPASEHITLLLKKQRLKIAHEWEKKSCEYAQDKIKLHEWVKEYFQKTVIPHAIRDAQAELVKSRVALLAPADFPKKP